jgi:MqsR (Motility quorum-sensing regulator) toxin of toxin-antitoxin system
MNTYTAIVHYLVFLHAALFIMLIRWIIKKGEFIKTRAEYFKHHTASLQDRAEMAMHEQDLKKLLQELSISKFKYSSYSREQERIWDDLYKKLTNKIQSCHQWMAYIESKE